MKTTRSLLLEIVRQGPPHNQLLSPTTTYLALCGRHAATSLLLDFEHHELLRRIQPLRYLGGTADEEGAGTERAASVQEVGKMMADLLGKIPGLGADLGSSPKDVDELLHLQLVVSAAELALLPFEAALAPPGMPGAGNPMSLQTAMPLSLTRQVRRAFASRRPWPRRPKILFAFSDAGGDVPAEEHVRVLRGAIAPWVEPLGRADAGAETNAGALLTLLPNATLPKIRDACAADRYTHVHLLAHGAAYDTVGGPRFGLALTEPGTGRMAIADGKQLAAALRAHGTDRSGDLSSPSILTIAACDAGNVGTVIPPGASLAHALHEEEIPLVITAQFPLSKAGSILMTHVLYSRLLWGDDPRVVLHDARQQLALLGDQYHDWASLVAYAAFPPGLDEQLRRAQGELAQAAAEAAIRRTDSLIDAQTSGAVAPGEFEALDQQIKRELAQLRLAQTRLLDALTDDDPASRRAEVFGRCASIEKRRSLVEYRLWKKSIDTLPAGHERRWLDQRAALEAAVDFYFRGLNEMVASHWLGTQYVAASWVLTGTIEKQFWGQAVANAWRDLRYGSEDQKLWAHGSLLELNVLAILMPELPFHANAFEPEVKVDPPAEAAVAHAKAFTAMAELNAFAVLSTRRNMKRYANWYIPCRREELRRRKLDPAAEPLDKLEAVAKEVVDALPVPNGPVEYPELE